jgi:hypothetical protein
MVPVGKHLVLVRKVLASGIDQINAVEAILICDFLGA